jgi:hypothetical protein
LARRSDTDDLVDATVVVGAVAHRDLVVTSDPDDLSVLATALHQRLDLHRI